MTQNWHDWVWRLGLTLAVGGTLLDSAALAQLTPDDTLGAEGSRVRPNATVNGRPADLIEGGATRGINLFHSFQEFNVEEQQRVYFDNPAGIDNIFSRVTGNNPSNILGTLGVDGAANLFLLNPNGILFGANASLDVQGSFLATTGNSFLFEDNEVFSATNPTAPSLLAVSVPLGVQYGANAPGAITVQGSALRVNEAQSLILAGGEVLLEDASLAVALLQDGQVVGLREGGRIDIGAVAGAGTLELSETNNLLSLRFPEDLARADIRLTDTTTLDVRANNGGDIAIAAQNIDILEGSFLLAGIDRKLGFLGGQAGDIRLNATEVIQLDQESSLSNVINSNVVGTGGNVEITTGTLQVSNRAGLITSTFGRGDAGDIIINARDHVSFDNGSAFSSVESLGAVGTGGNVEITTGTLRVSNGAGLVTRTFGQGNAGNVIINARDRAVFDGGSAFTNVASSEAVGTGGNVEITTGSLRVSNGAALNAITFGQGNAGNIIINARDRITFDGGSAFSNVGVGAVGTGGNMEIATGSLRVSNGAALSASTAARGDAGNIIINVRDRVTFDGGSARSIVESGAIGTGGRVEVTTGNLEVSNGAGLNATTRGQGDAGDVVINARDRVSFDGGSARSVVESGAIGTGGTVEITTDILQVNNETLLSASTFGEGNAGDIIINARDHVSINGNSTLSASTFGEGNAGDIIINARDHVSINGQSDVSTRVTSDVIGTGGDIVITTRVLSVTDALGLFAGTSGRGDAGDIIINARDRVSFDNSFVSTGVSSNAIGTGGDVVITTTALSVTNGAGLLAETSGRGDAGDVIINARDSVSFDFGFVSSTVGSRAVGTGGTVEITTGTLQMSDGAELSASTRGQGNAGNIIITDADTVSLSNSAIATAVEQGASGDGGSISIQTDSLRLSEGAAIAANSDQIGTNAGNIDITASGEVRITDSNITTSAVGAAGGAIEITAATVELRGDGDIRTNVSSGAGGGGNITVTADSVFAFDDSDILAFADDGRGGDVTLDTTAFFGENYQPAPEGTDPNTLDGNDRVDINASGAVAGVVSVPDLSFIQNSLSDLPQVPIDPDQLLANSCIARSDQRGSFIVTGAGGLPTRPGTAAASSFPTGTVQAIPQERSVDASNESNEEYRWQPGEPIVEPQGVYQLPNGRLVMSRECS